MEATKTPYHLRSKKARKNRLHYISTPFPLIAKDETTASDQEGQEEDATMGKGWVFKDRIDERKKGKTGKWCRFLYKKMLYLNTINGVEQ